MNRFSYQATVLLRPANGVISGTIRWDPHFLTFTGSGHDLFQINAFTLTQVSGGGPDNFPGTRISVEKFGATSGEVDRQGRLLTIPYAIRDLRLGVTLFVSVVSKPGAFVITNSPGPFDFVQVSGPSPITLSDGHTVEQPVDFEARQSFGPR